MDSGRGKRVAEWHELLNGGQPEACARTLQSHTLPGGGMQQQNHTLQRDKDTRTGLVKCPIQHQGMRALLSTFFNYINRLQIFCYLATARKPMKQAMISVAVDSPTNRADMIAGFTEHFSPLGQPCAGFTKSWPASALPYDIDVKKAVDESRSSR
ncbi:hypothetical protein MNBD_GAMMA18-678 [hydrothermal vent metagenome]|uniref:Uncharacterized protein n=1 Tax=hydrothermal vent metagenome TaxID=652676 RepID=A0A3B0Z6J3_9ZZZZ